MAKKKLAKRRVVEIHDVATAELKKKLIEAKAEAAEAKRSERRAVERHRTTLMKLQAALDQLCGTSPRFMNYSDEETQRERLHLIRDQVKMQLEIENAQSSRQA